MSAVNPYQPPVATVGDVSAPAGGFSTPRLWAPSGRIGRLRYLAYSAVGGLAIYAIAAVIGGLAALALGMAGFIGVIVIAYIAIVVLTIQLMVQRSHDMGWSGWTVLLALIPLVALVWLFKGGTPDANRWGAPPPPNTTGVKWAVGLAFALPVILGVLAAIAMPAYQDYERRAAEAIQDQPGTTAEPEMPAPSAKPE